MFKQVLEEARGNLAGDDLGRVVTQHDELHDQLTLFPSNLGINSMRSW